MVGFCFKLLTERERVSTAGSRRHWWALVSSLLLAQKGKWERRESPSWTFSTETESPSCTIHSQLNFMFSDFDKYILMCSGGRYICPQIVVPNLFICQWSWNTSFPQSIGQDKYRRLRETPKRMVFTHCGRALGWGINPMCIYLWEQFSIILEAFWQHKLT